MQRFLTLLVLALSVVAPALPNRADWLALTGVPSVRSLGQFTDGNILIGQDRQGRARLALERPANNRTTYIAWGAHFDVPASVIRKIETKTYAPVDVLLQLGGAAPAVVGLDAHTGRERWRESGRFVGQDDVRIIIEDRGQRVKRNMFTRARSKG